MEGDSLNCAQVTSLVSDERLSLDGRYQAAWSEQCTRISQRQGVIQIYLTAAGVVFGFWVSNYKSHSAIAAAMDATKDFGAAKASEAANDVIDRLLAWGVTALTCYSTALVVMHNRIIQRLTEFMSLCEYHARNTIKSSGSLTDNLFYFHDASLDTEMVGSPAPKKEVIISRVFSFHSNHRLVHRLILLFILGITNTAAIVLTWREDIRVTQYSCAFLLLASIVFLGKQVIEGSGRRLRRFVKKLGKDAAEFM